jgi:hypothetical protein
VSIEGDQVSQALLDAWQEVGAPKLEGDERYFGLIATGLLLHGEDPTVHQEPRKGYAARSITSSRIGNLTSCS